MEPGATITIKDLADLLFAARERIDFYWNFYVVVVVAVSGWLVSLKKTLTVALKALVSVVYFIAAATNLVGLHSAYTLPKPCAPISCGWRPPRRFPTPGSSWHNTRTSRNDWPRSGFTSSSG